jgi:hypothetical protein
MSSRAAEDNGICRMPASVFGVLNTRPPHHRARQR